jgi:hypothetical protein
MNVIGTNPCNDLVSSLSMDLLVIRSLPECTPKAIRSGLKTTSRMISLVLGLKF